jgi:hypothetical protein
MAMTLPIVMLLCFCGDWRRRIFVVIPLCVCSKFVPDTVFAILVGKWLAVAAGAAGDIYCGVGGGLRNFR